MTNLEKQIKEYLELPYKVGDNVKIFKNGYSSDYLKLDLIETNKENYWYEILAIDDNIFTLKSRYNSQDIKCLSNFISEKLTYNIGVNPFPVKGWLEDIKFLNKDLSSILNTVGYELSSFKEDYFTKNGIGAINWNPYVIDKEGKKVYYQRGFVWTVEDKQLLIESVINGIEIGKIVVRNRSFEWIEDEIKKGNTELFAKDIIDGKQRLNALLEFVQGKFPDIRGDFYYDYSMRAKHKFQNFMGFTYGEMGENTIDETVIKTFLNINFSGKPMSQEHIEYIKTINI